MAVAVISVDAWLQHLPFQGGQRPSPYGPVDGIFYGVVSGDGDNTGGNFTLSGSLSFDRKEDWIYVLGGINTSRNVADISELFTQINSGPLIPTGSAVVNPSFSRAGPSKAVTNNNITTSESLEGGGDIRTGMPIFGDKRLAGNFLMAAAGWAENTDAVTYQMSVWGWLIRYQSFFRNVLPSRG